jgi:hypothetical protein
MLHVKGRQNEQEVQNVEENIKESEMVDLIFPFL